MKFQKFIVAATLLLLASLIAWNSGFAQPPEAESKGKKIASVLQPYVEKQQLAGAVILVSGPEKTLCVESVGLADVATQKPLKSDAVFWIASMTKPITATALMMLVDEGKVKLDDPVAKHLPEFAGQMYVADRRDGEVVLRRPKQPVLVKNLLTHTSGMMGDSPVEPTHGCVPLKAAVAAYSLGPTTFAPGLEFEYNNPGINIAGRIIEVASGMPYEKFMQERLFDPLGMQDTTFFPNAAQLARLATSYKATDDKKNIEPVALTFLTLPLDGPNRHPFPGGGLFSTASDVASFCRLILNKGVRDGKRLLSESSIRAMTTTQTGPLINLGLNETGYGFGWVTTRNSQGESGPVLVGEFGHGGAYHTNMWIDPERDLITVYLTQHADHPGVDGEEILEAFRTAAKEAFGRPGAKATSPDSSESRAK